MFTRLLSSSIVVLLLASMGSAQTVRFDTNVGNFDVVLNPDNNPNLQGHVDNFMGHVDGGYYDNLLMNRSVPNFVLQMGRFSVQSIFPKTGFIDNIGELDELFTSVIVDADEDGTVDFDTTGLTNTRGKISLALSGPDSNSGANEFFVNFGNNSSLDPQDGPGSADFITFAEVPDMTTIDLILQLNTQDFFSAPLAQVPLLDNGTVVYVERAFELVAAAPASASSVPEPSGIALAASALMLLTALKRRKSA